MAGTLVTSGTLVASTVATVTFTPYYSYVTVVNSGATIIYVRTDGTAPTVAGDDCYPVLPSERAVLKNRVVDSEPALAIASTTTVKLISSGTPTYSVIGN